MTALILVIVKTCCAKKKDGEQQDSDEEDVAAYIQSIRPGKNSNKVHDEIAAAGPGPSGGTEPGLRGECLDRSSRRTTRS